VRQRIGEAAILRPKLSSRHFNYRRHEAPSELSDFVENLWTVTWDLPAGDSYTAEVLPYPSVNLSVTNTEADVTGLVRRRYERRLIGRGFAIGVRFRPACFRPFVGWPVSQMTDKHRPIADVLGRPTVELRQRIEREENQTRRAGILTAFCWRTYHLVMRPHCCWQTS
jgi:hypothetical protein